MRPLSLLSVFLSLTFFAEAESMNTVQALEHARRLLRSTPLIDAHNDLPDVIREKYARDVVAHDLRPRTSDDTDLVKLREGEVGAQFWSVYVPGSLKNGRFARTQLEQIDIARRMIAQYPESLALALTADEIEKYFHAGKIASLLGMEGGHVIENSLGALRAFYDLGVRYMTLTHFETIDWADSATSPARHGGLSNFGKEVVREMNRLGMLVDISHVSPETMADALDVSAAPVIFSHSSTRALTDHPRNVPDHILKRLAENGGVIMLSFIPAFVSQEVANWEPPLVGGETMEERDRKMQALLAKGPRPQATLRQVADHIEHARKIAGVDHIGIGSDFYGSTDMPKGLEDVSMYPYLFAELIQRGWGDQDLKKLAGQNLLRAMRQAEVVAAHLRKIRPASTALIEAMDAK